MCAPSAKMSITPSVMKKSDQIQEITKSSFKTLVQIHLFNVYKDPEFIRKVKNLPPIPAALERAAKGLGWRKPYEDLAHEFHIKYIQVYLYKGHGMNALLVGANLLPKGIARHNSEERLIELKLMENITQEDFYELWQEVDRIKREDIRLIPTRRRPPDDTDLIYAIFKARKKGLTFKQVFQHYQDGSLEYYLDKPRNQFASEDALQAYFYKYRPNQSLKPKS